MITFAAPPVDDLAGKGDMDEFEWERFMKDADARGKEYRELLEKYERYRYAVEELMGWKDEENQPTPE